MSKTYAAYKDSGLKWLGKVPQNWQVLMIKSIYRNFGSGSTPTSSETKYYTDGTINWVNSGDLNNGEINFTSKQITELALEDTGLKFYPPGSLAIAMYGQGETRGTVGLLNIKATTNQAVCMMHGSRTSVPKFMLWWFIAQKTAIRAINVGATQPNMNRDFIRNLFIALPAIAEQRAIANYLDKKTAQIDRKIELLTQKAKLYEELKRSVIQKAVTQGLDESAPFKNSEHDYFANIPQHWLVKRVKEIGLIVMGKMLNNKPSPNTYHRNYLKSKNIGWLQPQLSVVENMYFTKDEMRICRLKRGDLLMSEGGEVGKTCIWNEELDECYIQNSVHKITVFKGNCPRYFLYQSFFLGSLGYYDSVVNQVSIKHLTKEKLSKVFWLCPPISEQQAIASYLDKKTAQIDWISETIEAQISKLQEFRKTLINDVVTGKIKVTAD